MRSTPRVPRFPALRRSTIDRYSASGVSAANAQTIAVNQSSNAWPRLTRTGSPRTCCPKLQLDGVRDFDHSGATQGRLFDCEERERQRRMDRVADAVRER